MDKKYIVYYLFAEGESVPFYVGKTNRPEKRLIEHLSQSKNGKSLKDNKIRKVQREGNRVIFEIIARVNTPEEASKIEMSLISLHGRKDIGTGFLCNHTDGGEGTYGVSISNETRRKMSDAKIGNKLNCGRTRPDMIARFSKPITLYNALGVPVEKFMSAREATKVTGIKFSQISQCCLGDIQETKFGEEWVSFRFGYCEDNIAPLNAGSRPTGNVYLQKTLDGVVIRKFKTASEAQQETGIAASSIFNVVNGKAKTAGKFKWERILNA